MNNPEPMVRPKTLNQVAESSASLEEFGMNLRDWQHEIERNGVHSRPELARRMEVPPPFLGHRFHEGEIADAYLAAYAEWLSDRAGLDRPSWCADPRRVSTEPWFSTPLRGWLLSATPASFRQRNIFTVPEPIFHPRKGRPRASAEQKREKARHRQKAYRTRVRSLLKQARALGLKG